MRRFAFAGARYIVPGARPCRYISHQSRSSAHAGFVGARSANKLGRMPGADACRDAAHQSRSSTREAFVAPASRRRISARLPRIKNASEMLALQPRRRLWIFFVGARHAVPGEDPWQPAATHRQRFARQSACGVRRLAAAVFGRGLPRPIRGERKRAECAQARFGSDEWVKVAARPGKPGRQTAAASRRTPHGADIWPDASSERRAPWTIFLYTNNHLTRTLQARRNFIVILVVCPRSFSWKLPFRRQTDFARFLFCLGFSAFSASLR